MSRAPRDVGSFRGLEGLSDEVVQRLEQLRELVQRGAGTRGTSDALAGGAGGSTTNITITGSGGGGSSAPDLTPPPTPTGVVVNAGLTYVFIEHDAPTFTQGHGYARTKVYGATYEGTGPLPTFDPGAGTPLIHEFVGQVGAFPTNPATEWHMWVTWLTVDGVESVAPSGGTNGHVATTGQDVTVLLELLTGQITESQLYQALGAKIDALDPSQFDALAQSIMQAVVALHSEAKDRAADVSREASMRSEALLDEAAKRGAAITKVQTILQQADSSLAQDITDLTAAVTQQGTDTAAAIQLEETARVDADDAEALLREQLATRLDQADLENIATIESVRRTLSDADHAAAEQALNIVVATHTGSKQATAAILDQAEASTTATTAEAIKRETLSVALLGTPDPSNASLNTLSSGLLAEEKSARVTENDAAVQRLQVLEAKVDIPGGSSISSILTSYATLATLTSSQASQTSDITASFTAADSATLASAQAYVTTYSYSKAQSDSAIGTSVATVSARLNSGGDVNSAIVTAQSTASAKNATFKQGSAPTATRVGDTWIDTSDSNRLKVWDGGGWANSDDTRIGNTASSVTTLQSQISGATGSNLLSQIQTEATTRADETGHMSALYTVRVSLTSGGRSVIGGFGLSGTSSGTAGATIDFGVRADKFWIGAPEGATGVGDILPFIVQTTDQTVNGVLIPKGVYMDAAYIKNLTAMVARLGSAWIDNAMVANLSAAKIIGGSIAVGEYIQSSTYVANTSGWRIHGNGTAELQNAIVRGTVWATAGEFASTVRLGGASGFAAGNGIWQGLDGGTPKWRVGLENSKRIQWDGSELAIYGSANNKVMAVSGSTLMIDTPNFGIDTSGNARFSGDISGATGVFAGSLAAGVIDASTITGENFTRDTPGTYTVTTMPYSGKVRWTMCGAGGGGGGGGSVGESGIAGLPGSPGAVSTGEVTAPEGAVVTVFIPSGGGGAASGGSVSSPPAGSAGGQAWISISGVGTWYANGGAGGGTSTSPAGGIAYTYRMAEYGDFGGVLVAPAGASPSGIPGAYAGVRGLNGVDQNVLYLGLAGQASKLNGGNGYRGGGGGGGAPTRAWVPSRELYADPVDGEGGDGSPTSSGGNGGHGFAFIEIFNPNSVVLRNDFEAHKAELRAADLVVPGNFTSVFSGSSASLNLYTSYGRDIYSVKWANGQTAMVAIDSSNQTVVAQKYMSWTDGGEGPAFTFEIHNVVAVYRIRWQLNGAAIS